MIFGIIIFLPKLKILQRLQALHDGQFCITCLHQLDARTERQANTELLNSFSILCQVHREKARLDTEYCNIQPQDAKKKSDVDPYETSRSVYSLLQICCRCAGRSANNLQIICRRNQLLMLNKEPPKCTNQTKFFKRQTEEVGLSFIKGKHHSYENAG